MRKTLLLAAVVALLVVAAAIVLLTTDRDETQSSADRRDSPVALAPDVPDSASAVEKVDRSILSAWRQEVGARTEEELPRRPGASTGRKEPAGENDASAAQTASRAMQDRASQPASGRESGAASRNVLQQGRPEAQAPGRSATRADRARASGGDPRSGVELDVRSKGETEPPSDRDPESDTSAPVLLSLQFLPPEVRDGDEATVRIHARDNLSGVENIAGSLSSPSGKAVVAFSGQPSHEPDVFVGAVRIPPNGEAGVWHLTSLYIRDKANNSNSMHWSASNAPPWARLRVASAGSDSTPPVLHSIYLVHPTITPPETQKIVVTVDDDSSGVASVFGQFVSPSKNARAGFHCRLNASGQWEGEMSLPTDAACGEWTLEQLQLIDKANNRIAHAVSDPRVAGVSFAVVYGGSCDEQAPKLTSVVLQPLVVSNTEASTIDVSAFVADDVSGVAGVSLRADGPQPPGGGRQPTVFFSLTGDPDNPSAPWRGKLMLPRFSAKGIWRIGWAHVIDRANNTRSYSPSDPVLTPLVFEVQ